MPLSLPDRPWDMNPKEFAEAGFDEDSIEAQAWGEWDWLVEAAGKLYKENPATEAEVASLAKTMADNHKAVWGRFSKATAEHVKAVCKQ